MTDDSGDNLTLTFSNLPGTAASINSIKFVIKDIVIQSKSAVENELNVTIMDTLSQYYSTSHGYSSGAFQTITGATQTTSNGSLAWTVSQVNDIRIKLVHSEPINSTPLIDYIYYEVDYNIAATPVQDFIILSSGLIQLTSGKIII